MNNNHNISNNKNASTENNNQARARKYKILAILATKEFINRKDK